MKVADVMDISNALSENRWGTGLSSDPLNFTEAREVIEFVKNNNIKTIRIWFTDILGFLKSFSITPKELEGAFEEGMGFDGSSIQGYTRINESDMVAFPDPSTAKLIPFLIGGKRAIRMFADIRNPDGTPYANDPRQILKRNLNDLPVGVSTMNVGPEAEFYYFKEAGTTELLDRAGYFDLNPVDCGDDLREITIEALEIMGIPVEYSHHEVGPSQHEIDLRFKDALTMADNLMTYKWLVKEIAHRAGVHATFMPKPLTDQNGSGMHTHLSLFGNEDQNLFYEKSGPSCLSQTAQQFLAGVLAHACEMALVTNPSFNSYKRLVPGYEAPVYVAWSPRNRSALVRVPTYKPGKEQATRIELRFPDPTCNPYLAFSVMLQAGVHGIHNKYDLVSSVDEDIYELSPMEREKYSIHALPHDLYSAIQAAQSSTLLRKTLGEETFRNLIETKLEEDLKYRTHVTTREIQDFTVL